MAQIHRSTVRRAAHLVPTDLGPRITGAPVDETSVVANTRYPTTVVEDHVRRALGERHGLLFEKRRLPLTTGGMHEFDAVAAHGSIVASIKTASGLTVGGKVPSGKIKDSIAELYFLSLVDAPARLLLLTTPAFHEILMRHLAGKIAPGLEVLCEVLPPDVQAEVDAVQRTSSKEVFPVLDSGTGEALSGQ
jgi:hypothetical protein